MILTLPETIKAKFYVYDINDEVGGKLFIKNEEPELTDEFTNKYFRVCEKDEIFILDPEEGYVNETEENFINPEFYKKHKSLFDVI